MRIRYLAFLTLLFTGVVVLSVTHGQDPRNPPAPPTVVPATYKEATPAPLPPTAAVILPTPTRDFSKLTDPQKQAYVAAQRGAMWLCNMNSATGRFYYGLIPSLGRPLEGDNFLHQAAAAATMARAARITGDGRFQARAAGAILTLLMETVTDPKDAQVRYTSMPSIALSRLAAAGLLLAAIHELPAPQPDLLEKSDQLCNFIRRQARENGSLCTCDLAADGKPVQEESSDAVSQAPGLALYGLMLSQRQRPAAWKTDLARKAVGHYQLLWQANKNPAFVPAQTAAYTEAYLLTKEPEFAAFVFEMNDWLCGLQYVTAQWAGGFKGWKDGKELEEPPTIGCAVYGESLANACRIARDKADLKRHERYSTAVERHLVYLASLQYTLSNTQHFADAYRETCLSGGFHASDKDGNLRLDYTQQAVATILQYVEQVR